MKPLLILLLSCGAAFAGITASVPPLTFLAPDNWLDVPVNSPMRKAHWQVKEGEAVADVTFFQFGKDQGGTVNENIQRWLGQFSGSPEKAESALVEVRGTNIHFVRTEGTFSSGMPGGPVTPLPDYALRGAIIETAEGLVFVKMTGPKALVEKQETALTACVTAAVEKLKP